MKDFFGNPLNIGDEVAFIEVGYRSFKKGIVKAFTNENVRVESSGIYNPNGKVTTVRSPKVLVKNAY